MGNCVKQSTKEYRLEESERTSNIVSRLILQHRKTAHKFTVQRPRTPLTGPFVESRHLRALLPHQRTCSVNSGAVG